jgi:hypothetical protein
MPNGDDSTAATSQQTQQGSGSAVFAPARLREQFPEIVDLILASESMNDEERQYWIDILPVMTSEQVEQLHTILKNEKEQLAAIDAKYDPQIQAVANQERPLKQIAEERRNKMASRSTKEQQARKEEAEKAEDILKKMDDL